MKIILRQVGICIMIAIISTSTQAKEKSKWWIFKHLNEYCKDAAGTPEDYMKKLRDCKIIERQKKRGLVFMTCDFKTSIESETIAFNIIFADSIAACNTLKEQMISLEQTKSN